MILTGTAGHNIIWGSGTAFDIAYNSQTGDTVNFQYVTFNSTAAGFGYGFAFTTTTTITQCDNVTFTTSGNGSAFLLASGTKTLTNCTFSYGGTGEGTVYTQSDIRVHTGAGLQLSSCTFTTVGMQATSGWLISKNHNGVSNAYRFYGIANYNAADSAYRSGSSDNVTLMNADAYSTAFNTALTYNVAAAAKSLTINASTTATVNALITLTCCTVVNNGTFTLNGVLACGGILFPKYILDADSMLDIGNMIDSGAMIQVMV
jgi:hypothetical protein